MCLLCIEMTKDRLTKQDFINNYTELVVTDPKHAEDVLDKWLDKQHAELGDEIFELD